MATSSLTPVADYLRSSYEPDCEYVDGVLLERNVGERDHSALQAELTFRLLQLRRQLAIRIYVEQRIRIRENRYRIPDVCVVAGGLPAERVFVEPPYLCVEILSPRDSLSGIQAKITDYLELGVPNIWVLDPESRKAWTCDREGFHLVSDGLLRASGEVEIRLALDEIFAALD